MASSNGERGFAANSMFPGETKPQSAPAACPPSTLYSIEYHVKKIENADGAGKRFKEKATMDLMAADRLGSALRSVALSVLKRGRHRRSKWMKLEMTANDTAAVTSGRAPRCVCCAGVIEISADQDMSLGLNVALGLVSDECALICDSCTSRLIAAREASKPLARRR